MRPDHELLAALDGGDAEALRELFARHAPWLVLRLSRRCDDAGLVDETVQDTFERVWRHAGRFRGEGDVGAWMWGIAIRRLIDRLRRTRAVPVDPIGQRADRVVVAAEDEVLLGIEHGAAGAALGRLSPELRAVMRACALDGLTNREAAELLDIPTGTVKSRMRRARIELRKALA